MEGTDRHLFSTGRGIMGVMYAVADTGPEFHSVLFLHKSHVPMRQRYTMASRTDFTASFSTFQVFFVTKHYIKQRNEYRHSLINC